jgi:predicted small metal-binding protein
MQMYRQKEILWNPNCQKYGKAAPTNKAWKELAELSKVQEMTPLKAIYELENIRKQYIEKRETLTPEEISVYKLDKEWFSIAESFFGPLLFESSAATQKITNNQACLNEADLSETKFITDDHRCRACLQKHSINHTFVDHVQMAEIYKNCVGYLNPKLENLLPICICLACEHFLLEFHNFRDKCRSNETSFLGITGAIKSEPAEEGFHIEEVVELPLKIPNKDDYTSSIEKTFKCERCGKAYKERRYLLRHFKEIHKLTEDEIAQLKNNLKPKRKNESSAVRPSKTTIKLDQIQQKDKDYTCLKCVMQYNDRRSLMKHYRTVHKLTEDELEQMKVDNILFEFKRRAYKCVKCGLLSNHRSSLFKHLRNVHKLKADEVEQLKLNMSVILLEPKSEKHKPYQCVKCDNSFNRRVAFDRHLRDVHNVTEIESSEFSKKDDIDAMVDVSYSMPDNFDLDFIDGKLLEEVAEAEKIKEEIKPRNHPFKCEYCVKSFRQKRGLLKHFRLSHKLAEDVVKQLNTEIKKSKVINSLMLNKDTQIKLLFFQFRSKTIKANHQQFVKFVVRVSQCSAVTCSRTNQLITTVISVIFANETINKKMHF